MCSLLLAHTVALCLRIYWDLVLYDGEDHLPVGVARAHLSTPRALEGALGMPAVLLLTSPSCGFGASSAVSRLTAKPRASTPCNRREPGLPQRCIPQWRRQRGW